MFLTIGIYLAHVLSRSVPSWRGAGPLFQTLAGADNCWAAAAAKVVLSGNAATFPDVANMAASAGSNRTHSSPPGVPSR